MPAHMKRVEKMFCADRFHLPNGCEIKFLVPLKQFFFIPCQRCNLLLGEMNIEQCFGVMNKFFHFKKLYPLPCSSRRPRAAVDGDFCIIERKAERPPLLAVFQLFII